MSEHIEAATFAELMQRGILEIGDGYRARLEELGGDGPIFLRAGLLTDRGFDWTAAERFHADRASNLSAKFGHPGDTLVTTKGNSVGRTGFVPDNCPEFVYSPHLSYWRSLDPARLSPVFLRYWSRSPEFLAQLRSMANSTDMAPYLSLSDQRRLRVSLPGINAQEAIAGVLRALDDKIDVNDRIGQTALELAMANYRELSGMSRLGRVIPMSDCGRWLSGGTPTTSEDSYWGGNIPWISASSLKSPWINDSDRKVTVLGAANGTRLVPADTIIFIVRGMSLTSEFRIGLTQREVAFGQDCKALLPAPGIDAAVLFVAIRSQTTEILRIVDHAGHGTGRLPTDLLSKVMLSLPEDKSNEKATALLRPFIEIGAARQAENGNLRELRDMLLPKLMSGSIRVRDAEKVVEDVT